MWPEVWQPRGIVCVRFSAAAAFVATLQPSGEMMKKPLHTFVRRPEMQAAAAGNGNENCKRQAWQATNLNCKHKTMLRN